MQRSTGLMRIGQKLLLSIHDFFFFFGTFCFFGIIYTQGWHRMGRPIILALKLVISPIPAFGPFFGLPSQRITTRQNLQLGHRHEARHILRLGACGMTMLQHCSSPLGTNGFFKFHRYVLQPQIQQFIHNDSQFLLKLGWWWWWWCCRQCSSMYIM